MATELTLTEIRSRWNEVLDLLERRDRIAWIAYFDARLESYANGRLTLDFSDSDKFLAGHEYKEPRIRLQSLLQSAFQDIFGISVVVVEK